MILHQNPPGQLSGNDFDTKVDEIVKVLKR